MLNIDDKWALVTGASRGVGKQIAIELAGRGCNLVLHSRKTDHTNALAESLMAKGVEVFCVSACLEEEVQVADMLAAIEEKGIQIDIVYNVAAVNSNVLDFFSVTQDEFRMIFSVNVFSVAQICNYFIPRMLRNGFGRIVNVVSSVNNEPKAMAYGASKAALIKLSHEMAFAVQGTDIMINMADPGWVRTDMGTDNAPADVKECVAGMLLGVLLEDGISGRIFHAENYYGYTVDEAYEREVNKPVAESPDFMLHEESCLAKVKSLAEFKEKYCNFISSRKKKVIFGGGNQAKFFIDVLRYLGCTIDAVMCTRCPDGMDKLNGIPIYTLDKMPFEKKECIVIIAVTEQHVNGICKLLVSQGWFVLKSYGTLYSKENWKKEDGTPVSYVYQYRTNTFTGKGIGQE